MEDVVVDCLKLMINSSINRYLSLIPPRWNIRKYETIDHHFVHILTNNIHPVDLPLSVLAHDGHVEDVGRVRQWAIGGQEGGVVDWSADGDDFPECRGLGAEDSGGF